MHGLLSACQCISWEVQALRKQKQNNSIQLFRENEQKGYKVKEKSKCPCIQTSRTGNAAGKAKASAFKLKYSSIQSFVEDEWLMFT
jgi:hypothetical protein